jgi:hypothetical protein
MPSRFIVLALPLVPLYTDPKELKIRALAIPLDTIFYKLTWLGLVCCLDE